MKPLDLVLKAKWYDMIESGVKPEEYREIKPYWCTRIKGCQRICPYSLPTNEPDVRICQKSGEKCLSGNELGFTQIRFRRGYTSKSMLFNLNGIRIGFGDTKLGAPSDKHVFMLKLGEKIEETAEQ